VAQDGEEALRLALAPECLPDLVILDHKMPKMNGLDVLRAMRSEDRLKSVAIVCMSSSDDPKMIAALRKANVDEFCIKPVDPSEYMQKVAELIRRFVA
jgi:two-component system, response regulator